MASILKNKVWAGPFQIMAAASYLGRKIFVFGCHLEKKCRYETCLKDHEKIHSSYWPLTGELCTDDPITILYVNENHFEPILPHKYKQNFWASKSEPKRYNDQFEKMKNKEIN